MEMYRVFQDKVVDCYGNEYIEEAFTSQIVSQAKVTVQNIDGKVV
jgi:hypothetical protein